MFSSRFERGYFRRAVYNTIVQYSLPVIWYSSSCYSQLLPVSKIESETKKEVIDSGGEMKKVSYKIHGYFDWSRGDAFRSCDVILLLLASCSSRKTVLQSFYYLKTGSVWYLFLIVPVPGTPVLDRVLVVAQYSSQRRYYQTQQQSSLLLLFAEVMPTRYVC